MVDGSGDDFYRKISFAVGEVWLQIMKHLFLVSFDVSDSSIHVGRCLRPPSSQPVIRFNFSIVPLFLLLCVIDPGSSPQLFSRFPQSASHNFPDHNAPMYVALTHSCMVPSGFCTIFFSFLLREGGRELFAGEIMGKYHPLLHELDVQASEMAEGKLDDVTTVNVEPPASLWRVGASETQEGEIESIENFFLDCASSGCFASGK